MKSRLVFVILVLLSLTSTAQNNLDLDLTTAFDSTDEGKRKLARKLERKKKRDLRRARNRDTTAILNDLARFNNSLIFNFVDNPAYTGQEAKNQINAEGVYSPFYKQETFSYNLRYTSIFEKEREKLKGKRAKGLGFYLQTEQQFAYKQARVGVLSFSRHFNIKNKVVISVGASMEYIQNKVDISKFTYLEQKNGRDGWVYNGTYLGGKQYSAEKSSNINSIVGMSIRTNKFYTGFFIQNVTTPNESVTFGNSPLPVFFGLNASRNFRISSSLIFKPEFFITKFSSTKTKMLVGHVVFKQKYLYGIGIKSNNIAYTEVGLICKRFRFLLNTQIRFSKSVYESNELNNLKLNIRYQF